MAANIQGSKMATKVFSEWLWLRNMIAYKKWAYSDLNWLSYDYFNKIQDGRQKYKMAAKLTFRMIRNIQGAMISNLRQIGGNLADIWQF